MTLVAPSMFGRDLTEQVHADSKDGERMVPVIVEKCIDAVECHGMSLVMSSKIQSLTFGSHGLRGYLS
jgi:hypothetical protein